MVKRFPWIHVFLAVTAPILLFGCSGEDEHTTVYVTQPPVGAGVFPSVHPTYDAHNHAVDGRAFSESGQSVSGLRWFPNGGRSGAGILLHTTRGGSLLWASYHNAGNFSPPIEIQGERQNTGASVWLTAVCVLWLNGVAGRDGDAIILFRRATLGLPDDADNDGTPEDGSNSQLYSAYFDLSLSGVPSCQAPDGADLQYGFTPLGTFVDTDPSGDDDDTDSPVASFGFVSDGLCFSSAYTQGSSTITSGDNVTFAYAVWTQEVEFGDVTSDTPVGRRVWYNPFDLSGTTTRFLPGNAATLGSSSSISLQDPDVVIPNLIAHNGLLIWTLDTITMDPSDNDRFLQANVFDASGVSSTQLLSRQDDDAADWVQPLVLQPRNLYGDDHGLPQFWFFFREDGYNEAPLSGEPDLMAATVDLAGTTAEVAEIDEFTQASGPDAAGVAGTAPVFTVISRGGGHIAVGWHQPHLTPNEDAGLSPRTTPPRG
ncbi:MAG: hypothetical protein ACYTHM_07960 [Planctomycetota bacterium]|jgi:hypothetical protein